MATFITSDPSMGTEGTLPTNAGQLIRGAEFGIDNLISGFIIQSESISESVMTDVTQDQKSAVVSELDYDKRWDLNITMIGDTEATLPESGDITFAYGGHKWKLDSVTYNGSYQDKKSWSLTAHRYYNFPAQD